MGTKTIPLTAGQTQRLPYAGQMLQLVDLGVATKVQVAIEWKGQQDLEDFGQVDNRFRVFSATEKFSGFELTSTVDTTVTAIVSYRDVKVSDTENATVHIDTTQLPLPVTGVDETLATATVNNVATAVTDVIVQICPANANVVQRRISNVGGSTPMAIGAAGLTWAKRCIVLNPGDVWIEKSGAQLAWYAICDAGLSTSANVQDQTA